MQFAGRRVFPLAQRHARLMMRQLPRHFASQDKEGGRLVPYVVLGLSRHATLPQIRARYLELVRYAVAIQVLPKFWSYLARFVQVQKNRPSYDPSRCTFTLPNNRLYFVRNQPTIPHLLWVYVYYSFTSSCWGAGSESTSRWWRPRSVRTSYGWGASHLTAAAAVAHFLFISRVSTVWLG